MSKLINITIVADSTEQLFDIEKAISRNYNVSSIKYLPDTKDLYDNDPVFRKLVKGVKDATLIKDRYLNDHLK